MADNYCACSGDGSPEYIIRLDGQGPQGPQGPQGERGFSPVVNYVIDNDRLEFTLTNEDGIQQTPDFYDYLAKTDLSNVVNPVTLAGITYNKSSVGTSINSDYLFIKTNGVRLGHTLTGTEPEFIIANDGSYIEIGNISDKTIKVTSDGAYYNTHEIATINDLPIVSNSTVTINQGGVTKGTFTLNKEGDTVIDLDSSGAVNPLVLTSPDGNNSLTLNITNNTPSYTYSTSGAGGGSALEVALLTTALKPKGIEWTKFNGLDVFNLKVDSTTLAFNEDDELTVIGGGGGTPSVNDKYGIKGDYSTHYGILDCPNGLIEYDGTDKQITVNAGIVLQLAGQDIKTTIASPIKKILESTGSIVLFYAGGDILECGTVDYSTTEPAENGTENYQAWYNPVLGKWKFKSNATGNVWREAIATPIANINIVNGNVTRIDYIGYRILDDDIIATKAQVDALQNTINGLIERIVALETKIDGGNA